MIELYVHNNQFDRTKNGIAGKLASLIEDTLKDGGSVTITRIKKYRCDGYGMPWSSVMAALSRVKRMTGLSVSSKINPDDTLTISLSAANSINVRKMLNPLEVNESRFFPRPYLIPMGDFRASIYASRRKKHLRRKYKLKTDKKKDGVWVYRTN